jgi:hypothetical protein
VKERRKGPIGRAAGLAEGVAATVRRMQREREPRVLVYDETGYARLVQPDGRGYERLLETAEKMVALVAAAEAKPRRGRRSEAEGESGGEAKPGGAAAEAETKARRGRRTEAGGEAKPGRAAAKPRRADAKPRRSRRAPGEGRA